MYVTAGGVDAIPILSFYQPRSLKLIDFSKQVQLARLASELGTIVKVIGIKVKLHINQNIPSIARYERILLNYRKVVEKILEREEKLS